MNATPFTDPELLPPLYVTAAQLAQRTEALHAAKIGGEDATTTIAQLTAQVTPSDPVACDVGCGRGTTTLSLAAPGTPVADPLWTSEEAHAGEHGHRCRRPGPV